MYAHQKKFNDSLESYIKREQYRLKSNEVELFPKMNELPVKEGDLLGYLGNSGGSTGPHLHFELRDEITEIPLNPLLIYSMNDSILPVLNQVSLFDLQDSIQPSAIKFIPVRNKKDSLFFLQDTIIVNKSILGLGYSGYDTEIISGNPNNIYEAKILMDNELIYHHRLNYIPFDKSNYINEYLFENEKIKFQKYFIPAIFPSDIYIYINNRGRIELKDTLFHKFRIEIYDEAGNKNELNFYLKTRKINGYKYINYLQPTFINAFKAYSCSYANYTITLPPSAIYNHGFVQIKDEFANSKKIIFNVPNTNMHLTGSILIHNNFACNIPPEKWVLKNEGSVTIPVVRNTISEYSFKNLGKLEWVADTTGPLIKPSLTLKKLKSTLPITNKISFKLSDNISGIAQYHVFVNGIWVVAEYDAKASLLTYYFDGKTPFGNLTVLVTAIDKTGNSSSYKLSVQR